MTQARPTPPDLAQPSPLEVPVGVDVILQVAALCAEHGNLYGEIVQVMHADDVPTMRALTDSKTATTKSGGITSIESS